MLLLQLIQEDLLLELTVQKWTACRNLILLNGSKNPEFHINENFCNVHYWQKWFMNVFFFFNCTSNEWNTLSTLDAMHSLQHSKFFHTDGSIRENRNAWRPWQKLAGITGCRRQVGRNRRCLQKTRELHGVCKAYTWRLTVSLVWMASGLIHRWPGAPRVSVCAVNAVLTLKFITAGLQSKSTVTLHCPSSVPCKTL